MADCYRSIPFWIVEGLKEIHEDLKQQNRTEQGLDTIIASTFSPGFWWTFADKWWKSWTVSLDLGR